MTHNDDVIKQLVHAIRGCAEVRRWGRTIRETQLKQLTNHSSAVEPSSSLLWVYFTLLERMMRSQSSRDRKINSLPKEWLPWLQQIGKQLEHRIFKTSRVPKVRSPESTSIELYHFYSSTKKLYKKTKFWLLTKARNYFQSRSVKLTIVTQHEVSRSWAQTSGVVT